MTALDTWRATATEEEIRIDREIRERRGLLDGSPAVARAFVADWSMPAAADAEVRDVGERARLGLPLTAAQERELVARVVGPRQIFGVAMIFGSPGTYRESRTGIQRQEIIRPGALDGWLSTMGNDYPVEVRAAHHDVRVGTTDRLFADHFGLWMLATTDPTPEGDRMLEAAIRGELGLSAGTHCRDDAPADQYEVERRHIDVLREISLTATPGFVECRIVAAAGKLLYPLDDEADVVAEAERLTRDAAAVAEYAAHLADVPDDPAFTSRVLDGVFRAADDRAALRRSREREDLARIRRCVAELSRAYRDVVRERRDWWSRAPWRSLDRLRMARGELQHYFDALAVDDRRVVAELAERDLTPADIRDALARL